MTHHVEILGRTIDPDQPPYVVADLVAAHATFPDDLEADYYAVDDFAIIAPRHWPER